MGCSMQLKKFPHQRYWSVQVKGQVPEQTFKQMQEWCFDNEVGRRVSRNQFDFFEQSDALQFFLKWTS